MQVRTLADSDRDWAATLVTQHFGSPVIVTRGICHDTRTLPGLVVQDEGMRLGLLQYCIVGMRCEVVVLIALRQRQGLSRRMLSELSSVARAQGCRCLWLITTNDNRVAQRFYAALGWREVAVHRDAVTAARKLKPEIPEYGQDGIPIVDEIEYEFSLDDAMLRLLQANQEDLDALQAVFEVCPDYFERCLGGPAGPAEAQSSFANLPPGRSYDDKFVFGILAGERMIGCAEIFRNHPNPGTAYLTLLLIAPEFRGRGFGRAALNELHAFARTECGAKLMRTALVDPDRAPIGFFTRHGYAATGERRPYRYFRFESEVAFFHCDLQHQP